MARATARDMIGGLNRKYGFANATYTPPKSTARKSTSSATIRPGVGINQEALTGGAPAPAAKALPTARVISSGSSAAATPVAQAQKMAGTFSAAANTGTVPVAASGTGGRYNDAAQGGFGLPGDPWTGFSSRYAPAYADILLSNPTQIFYDQAMNMGLQQPGGEMGAVQALAPYGDLMPFLYSLFNSGRANAGSPEAQTNFIAQFAKNMLTPGGSAPSIQGIMSSVYGNPDIAELYNTGNPAENVNTLNDMIGMAAGLSFNPVMQRMVQARNDRLAYEYLSDYTQGGNPGSYADFVRQRGGAGSFYG